MYLAAFIDPGVLKRGKKFYSEDINNTSLIIDEENKLNANIDNRCYKLNIL